MNKNEYLTWEAMSRDTIDVKRAYVDLAGGDLTAGVLLAQIVYWHLPGSNGRTKLRVRRAGHIWLAKAAQDWWQECRIKPRQASKCLKLLKKEQLIIIKKYKFNGAPTTHIRLNWLIFLEKINKLVADGEAKKAPEAAKTIDLPKSVKSILPDRANPFVAFGQIFNKDYTKDYFNRDYPPTPTPHTQNKSTSEIKNDRARNVHPI